MPTTRQRARGERLKLREAFRTSKTLERHYTSALVQVGQQVGKLVHGLAYKGKITDLDALESALTHYSNALTPWANAVVGRMQSYAASQNLLAWKAIGREIGRNLRREVEEAPIAVPLARLRMEHVGLITSLPREAAIRVADLAQSALYSGRRAEDIARDIMDQGNVSVGQARRLARTAASTTASNLTQVRAVAIGSEGYMWRGVMDSVERKMHVALQDKFIPWNQPPVAGKGKGGIDVRYHAGCGPNCRCWPEPVLPEIIQ